MRIITLSIGESKRCMNRMCCKKYLYYNYYNKSIKERISDR